MLLKNPVGLFGVTCAASLGQAKVARAWQRSDLWKLTRERPSLPDLILHIELGAPLGEGGWVDV